MTDLSRFGVSGVDELDLHCLDCHSEVPLPESLDLAALVSAAEAHRCRVIVQGGSDTP